MMDVAVVRKAKERNNFMISRSLMVFEEVLTGWNLQGGMNKSRMLIKDVTLFKQVLRFYSEYVGLYEKNLQKKDKSFPSVPVKIFAYRQLSMLNSNDKILEKKFKNVV
jgi:hypothetical protein